MYTAELHLGAGNCLKTVNPGNCWHPTRRTTARRAGWARRDHKRRYLYNRMRQECWSVLVARLHAGICHHSPRKGYIGFPEFRQLRTEHLLGASDDSAPRRSRTGNYIKLGNIPHLFWHSPVLPGNFPAGKNQPHTESDRDVRGSAQLYSRLQSTLPHVNRRTLTYTLPQLPSPLGLGALCSQSVRVPPLAVSRGCAPFWRRTGTRCFCFCLCQPTLRINTARTLCHRHVAGPALRVLRAILVRMWALRPVGPSARLCAAHCPMH